MKIENLRAQLALGLALMLFGFGVVMQLRSREMLSERLEAQSERDLVEIIDTLDNEIRSIRLDITDQRIKLLTFKDSESSNQDILSKAESEISDLKVFVGEKKVSGPGILIRIKDKHGLLTGFDLRQIIEELRSLGAWAIAVNDIRIDYQSSFWRRSGSVYLDKEKLSRDYRIQAIGERALLFQTITMPRGIKDKLKTLKGVQVKVSRDELVRLQPSEHLKPWKLTRENVTR
ncbi:MAG TPA: DUF881 domain-containing protein [Actinobacteria bacterium]|nr:DUF881 domain-containing protein [Actinomycetota bacterium]